MTPKEALKEIIKDKKWYVCWTTDDKGNIIRDSKKESSLRITALRILNGTARETAVSNFFGHFNKRVIKTVEDNEPI